jgi:hypothetical protein
VDLLYNLSFKLNEKDGNYDACKTANIKISGREILSSGLQRVTAAVRAFVKRVKSSVSVSVLSVGVCIANVLIF